VYGKEYHPNQPPSPTSLGSRVIPTLDEPGDQAGRARRARAFIEEMGGSVRRFLLDADAPGPGGAVQQLYGAGAVARIVVVDTQGQVAFSKTGLVVPELEKCLQGMLAAPAPPGHSAGATGSGDTPTP
jgi:hypothetical protein